MEIFRPLHSSRLPIVLAATPFPKLEHTPLVTKINVLAVINYSVAYGTDLGQAVKLADSAVNQLRHRWTDLTKPAKSVIGELGDSSVNLKMFVWAVAPKKSYVISDVLKCIYDTFNQNGIEIPFPQQDIHIKQ